MTRLTERSTPNAPNAPNARGIYGPSGWLSSSGIDLFLAPFASGPSWSGDYSRFDGVSQDEAVTLLDALPSDNLPDRQNSGPSVEEALEFARTHPGTRLGGYVIRAPRHDERLSIDTLAIPREYLPSHCDLASHCTSDQWPTLRDTLELAPTVGAPDEAYELPSTPNGCTAWTFWWD
ncbi:hypothetical protein [Schaalia sp. ZJ1691]|uniref:hypothetical protein n=1 Tax=Schaalia sp. ZJ1691 TaxID=2709404 RepID=UPI0013EDBBAB|nr:hypothetical protein [Schaalia sp. ZJ1691]